jgi:hypothetical protein
MRWTENAEATFVEEFGDLRRAGFDQAWRSLRGACERVANKRVAERWPYAGMVEMNDVEAVRDFDAPE